MPTETGKTIDGLEGNTVKDPDSVFHGQRQRNGWEDSGYPGTYELTPERLLLLKPQG